ncbi:MAG: glycosyltransferase family 2 protein [Desulfomonile tiedjei]|nr:glycosyltransferase family 2 protein [Desulfomonile tiedjei]
MSVPDQDIEVSAIMPCLDEEETVASCIGKAMNCFAALGIRGEVVVGDNGSTDRSVQIAESLGARVVTEPRKGYGAALKAAIKSARGRYCIMADCDDSYDWSGMGPFIEKLRQGYDLVMGTRLKGTILPGAMPPLHRFFGNPFLSGTMNLFFRTGVSDAYCGMRGFSKEAFSKLNVQAVGMEFAIEMIIKASNQRMKITEVPITLHVDGRSRPPHLRSFRDGWRTLRLLLFYAPDYLYLIPGGLFFIVGAVLQIMLLRGPVFIKGFYMGVHWLALGCLFSMLGLQILSLGAFAKAFAMNDSFEMSGRFFGRLLSWFTLEAGIVVGGLMIWLGVIADIAILTTWLARDMGYLGSTHAVFVATTVIAIGFQVVFSSFFLGMFKLHSPAESDEAMVGADDPNGFRG